MTYPPEALPIPQSLLNSASLLSDRYTMLPLLPKRAVFAEVGVGLGGFSEHVLATCEPSLFLAIDDFRLHELAELWGQPTETLFASQTHGESYRARFADAIASGSMRVIEGDSADCLAQLENNSLDVVYIDAGHFYDDVRRDLATAHSKMREDSWIIVNDYIMVAELAAIHSYGVVNATNEFMIEHGWGVQYFALQRQMFCDVALRPQRYLQHPGAAVHALTAEIGRLRREVATLRSSTSWRVTEPMRAAVRYANKLRR